MLIRALFSSILLTVFALLLGCPPAGNTYTGGGSCISWTLTCTR